MKTRKAGFTLLEIMLVVAIIGLLAVIAIPSFLKARTTSQKNACINNLRQIEAAKEQWALETRQGQGASVISAELDSYMRTPPSCPGGGTYNYGTVGSNATCTISGHELL